LKYISFYHCGKKKKKKKKRRRNRMKKKKSVYKNLIQIGDTKI